MTAGLLRLLAPAPDAVPVEPARVRALYGYWRARQLYATFVGYAVFYFVRKNISVALPLMETSLGISKSSLGAFLTAHDLTYGVSKFANGAVGDRSNARYFMPAGLALSALANVAFGLSSGLTVLGLVWVLNGYFQGMGFPPCARILSHWFGPRERGTKWGLWNTSHQVGAATILVLAGAVGARLGWRACFLVPAAIALATSAFLLERLRDTPGSLGLPPVEQYTGDAPVAAAPASQAHDAAEYRALVRERVFGNPSLWMICVGNFFVYAVRYAFLNWAPSYLRQVKHVPLGTAGTMVAGFEIAGLVGSLVAGWLTDRFFRGRRAPMCAAYMLVLAGAIYAFWRLPGGSRAVDAALLFAIGFAVYGPQFLVGVMAADLATKRAAATAIGLTGIFGYASGVISGVGFGWVVDHWGWDGGFRVLLACALLGVVPFALAWRARPAVVEP